MTADAFDAEMAHFSGLQDLSRLTRAQLDRLEQGFQQAITDDRRLHRWYVALGNSSRTSWRTESSLRDGLDAGARQLKRAIRTRSKIH